MTVDEARHHIISYILAVRRAKIRADIKEAAQRVAGWPAWKRGAAASILRPKTPQKQGKK